VYRFVPFRPEFTFSQIARFLPAPFRPVYRKSSQRLFPAKWILGALAGGGSQVEIATL